MESLAIIRELANPIGLPRAAITAASEQREEMAPIFIAEIEKYTAGYPDLSTEADTLFFMFHLLGEWRETSAYPALARFLRLPGEHLDGILDDAITCTVHRVMAAVFDGDPQPLFDIILDPEADDFIRAGMFETVAMLVAEGKLSRAVATEFLRDGFTRLQPQGGCFVWYGWQSAIAMLGLEELTPLVEEAFKREYVTAIECDISSFRDDLQRALATQDRFYWLDNADHQPFASTIEEFEKWTCFADDYDRSSPSPGPHSWQSSLNYEDKRYVTDEDRFTYILPEPEAPVINPDRHVGRNDPCPCGSGKKFKKCCLK